MPMKKRFFFIPVLILLVSLSACGSEGSSSSSGYSNSDKGMSSGNHQKSTKKKPGTTGQFAINPLFLRR